MTSFAQTVFEKRSHLSPRTSAVFALLAFALSHLSAQVSFTGSSGSQNLGAQPILAAGAAQPLSFSIAAGTTVGSIAVVTGGVPNLDFASAASSTCAAQHYSASAACVVNVTFTPTVAGLRLGAVLFFSKSNGTGNVLGSAMIYGTGTGPQIAFGPGIVSAVDRLKFDLGLVDPIAVAADAAGDLYILDTVYNSQKYRLVQIPAGNGTPVITYPSANGEPLYLPSCIALDGAGDLFIGDFYGRIVEVPIGGGTSTAIYPTANGLPLAAPSGLAVDGVGDIYVSDYRNNRVLEIPAGNAATITIVPVVNGIPLNDPHGLATDSAGDLFIADLANDRVLELPAAGGPAVSIDPTVNGQSLENPVGVALDAAGDLYIADNVNQRVVEVPAGGGEPVAIDPDSVISGTGGVYGVTLDGFGNLFIVQEVVQGGPHIIEEIEHAQPAAVAFSAPTFLNTADSVDGPLTIQAVNIGNLPLMLAAISYPEDFPEASGDANACTAGSDLAPGQQCDLPISFSPVNYGALAETIVLTDDSLNSIVVQQSVQVTGLGLAQPVLVSPAPASTLPGPKVQFAWTTTPGVTKYVLWVGTTGPGSRDVMNSGYRTATVLQVPGLPTTGETVNARLISYYGTLQKYSDYTFTAASICQKAPVSLPGRPPVPGPVTHDQLPPLPIVEGSGLAPLTGH